MAHAFLSASGSPYWLLCEAKPWREKDLPEYTSKYAEEGTAAHALLEHYLKTAGNHIPFPDPVEAAFDDEYKGMSIEVQKTISVILNLDYNELYSEQQLDISFITGEQDAKGTVDVILIKDDTLTILDLKYGKGVKVDAENNSQLLIYAAAAVKEYDKAGTITKVRMMIHQPRIKGHLSEWVLTKDELQKKIDELKVVANRILRKGGDLNLPALAGRKQCQFCRAKAGCEEYKAFRKPHATDSDFPDLTLTN